MWTKEEKRLRIVKMCALSQSQHLKKGLIIFLYLVPGCFCFTPIFTFIKNNDLGQRQKIKINKIFKRKYLKSKNYLLYIISSATATAMLD